MEFQSELIRIYLTELFIDQRIDYTISPQVKRLHNLHKIELAETLEQLARQLRDEVKK